MGMAIPRRGNHSTTPWNSQSHAVELAVPKPGTRSPKAWNSQSQNMDFRLGLSFQDTDRRKQLIMNHFSASINESVIHRLKFSLISGKDFRQ